MKRIKHVGIITATALAAMALLAVSTAGATATTDRSARGDANGMTAAPAAQERLLQANGKLSLLRVHEVGTGFGPDADKIDAEVVIRLDNHPGMGFGFQLRDDANGRAHQGMLDLLRDAFTHDWTVTIDYSIAPGQRNGEIMRAWLTK